jgi:hypothetical protein
MIDWLLEAALAVDTCRTVARWWVRRCPSGTAPVPECLVHDLQMARLALDDRLQVRLWNQVDFLARPERMAGTMKIAELGRWDVFSEKGRITRDPAAVERGAVDEELIEALKERARKRERLDLPTADNRTRRRLRDLAGGRGRLAAVL